MPIAFAALGGLIIGSFLNVVAYRLPRGESLVSPGLALPGCGVAIKPYDNLPVVGWLLLRGRCRACGAQISPRYPIVELPDRGARGRGRAGQALRTTSCSGSCSSGSSCRSR